MAVTKISDIVYNTIFGKYFTQALADKSVFIKSGIAAVDPQIAEICEGAGVQGLTVNLPYWNDIDGPSEVLSQNADLTVTPITAGQDVAVILRRGKAFGSNDLSAEIAGSDPMRVVADKVADYWSRDQQRVLFATLNGVFADNIVNDGSDLVLDITQEPGDDAYLNKNSLLFAAQLLGDAKASLAAIAMHSMVETVLNVEGNTGSAFKPAETAALLPTYNGRAVVMDDHCAYNPTTGIADIYLFGNGAVALNPVPSKTPLETGRAMLASNDLLATRQAWISHIRGIKWTGAAGIAGATPSDDDLANGANWDRVWAKKDIRVVKLRCKIAA